MAVSVLLKIGICDDQQEWADRLQSLLQRYIHRKNLDAEITAFSSGEELLASDWQLFQILFLDIVMGKQDGIQAAIQIRRKNPGISLIFVSAYLDYATMGYQVKASAYLLKSQLATTLEGAMDAVLTERRLNQGMIEIKADGCRISLPLLQIIFVEIIGKTAVFHCEREYKTHMRFSDIEMLLSGKGFLRIQRSYIINMAHCVGIRNYQAILDDGRALPCSRQEYPALVQNFMRWKGMNR